MPNIERTAPAFKPSPHLTPPPDADAVYLVRSGFVKLVQRFGEGDVVVSYLSKGMTLGEVEVLVEGLGRWEVTASALEYAELVARAGGIACSFNATVYAENLHEVPVMLDWAHRHIDIVQTMVFICFRHIVPDMPFKWVAGDREVEPGIGILRSPGRRAGEGPLRFSPPALVGEGETAPVRSVGTPGNLLVKNNAFFAPRREDGSFADFTTDLSVYRSGEEVARKTIRVNDPLTIDGFVFHQNTFGPTAELAITDASGALVWDGPLLLDDELLGLPQGFMTIPGAPAGLVAVLNESADGQPQLVLQGIGPADADTGANPTLFLVTIPTGVTTDPEVTADHAITWDAVGSWHLTTPNHPSQYDHGRDVRGHQQEFR